MLLYHGSDVLIETIDLSKSQYFKDSGRGFYLSDNFKQANDFAKYKAAKPSSETRKPFVTTFCFDENNLKNGELLVLEFNSYSETWIDFIDRNRNAVNQDYDVIIGPIANDQVRSQFLRYENGEINKFELLDSLKYKHLTFQYCFVTEKAISKLERNRQ